MEPSSAGRGNRSRVGKGCISTAGGAGRLGHGAGTYRGWLAQALSIVAMHSSNTSFGVMGYLEVDGVLRGLDVGRANGLRRDLCGRLQTLVSRLLMHP